MQITAQFRDQILFAMPELSKEDADKIAGTEQCTTTTVYNHWKKLKSLEGEVSTIMLSIGEVAASRKKLVDKNQKRMNKIHEQLSAA
jgi:hypothetical protein